jgi:hypothetical protein
MLFDGRTLCPNPGTTEGSQNSSDGEMVSQGQRYHARFQTPSILTNETVILGTTAKMWDAALTGNISETLMLLRTKLDHLSVAQKDRLPP